MNTSALTPLLEGLAPFSQEAEQAVIGAALVNSSVYSELADTLRVADFYFQRHEVIWSAFARLAVKRQPIDYVTVVSELTATRQLDEIGGMGYLLTLVNNTPSAYHAPSYAQIVRLAATRRRILAGAEELKALARDETISTDDLLARMERVVSAITATAHTEMTSRSVADTVDALMTSIFDRVEGKLHGIPTGLKDLDGLIGGLAPGNLMILSGRPGMGKSALLATIIVNLLKAGARVGLLTLEMADTEIVGRILSNFSSVDNRYLFNKAPDADKLTAIGYHAQKLRGMPLYIDERAGAKPAHLKRVARAWARKHAIDVLFTDYIQLFHGDTQTHNRVTELDEIVMAHKEIAKELHIPVITAAQVSRAVESRNDKRPTLADLRESGSLEATADIVGLLYRASMYDEHASPNLAELNIAKNRNGATGTIALYYDAPRTRFADLARDRKG
ncbi:MAG: replicative DNA helicase [Chloroflexota bacterium]|nr:replicative DNA helicase [Chloroflexota bacterium]